MRIITKYINNFIPFVVQEFDREIFELKINIKTESIVFILYQTIAKYKRLFTDKKLNLRSVPPKKNQV